MRDTLKAALGFGIALLLAATAGGAGGKLKLPADKALPDAEEAP